MPQPCVFLDTNLYRATALALMSQHCAILDTGLYQAIALPLFLDLTNFLTLVLIGLSPYNCFREVSIGLPPNHRLLDLVSFLTLISIGLSPSHRFPDSVSFLTLVSIGLT